MLKCHLLLLNCMFILVEPLEPELGTFMDHTQAQLINILPSTHKPVLLSLYTAVGPVHEEPPLRKGWPKARDRNAVKMEN